MIRDERLLTSEDEAEQLLVSPPTFRNDLRTAQLKRVKVVKHWRVHEAESRIFLVKHL